MMPPTDPYATDPYAPDPYATAPGAVPPRTTRRRRRRIAAVLAGGLLAGVVGVTAVTTTSVPVATIDSVTDQQNSQTWSPDLGGGSVSSRGTVDPWGSSGSGSPQSDTVDSDSATSAQQQGVALIDTVLDGGEGAGTGIVLTSDGEVLTNYHVVEDSTSIRVTIASTGTTYTASVVGSDPDADIALLQLRDASGLTVATIDDDTLAVGDDVTAVGNAGGTGTLTAATGDVTDLSTSITTASEGSIQGETLDHVIETDADVVAGDSGGPLIDDEGEVVGIDTAASTGQEINGYAIPIDVALAVVTQIRDGDESDGVQVGASAFLGIELDSTASYGGADPDGAPVAGVVDGDAADDAGLSAGDVITKLGSTTISDTDDLTAALATLSPGDRTKITWATDDGQTESATVTLGSSPVN